MSEVEHELQVDNGKESVDRSSIKKKDWTEWWLLGVQWAALCLGVLSLISLIWTASSVWSTQSSVRQLNDEISGRGVAALEQTVDVLKLRLEELRKLKEAIEAAGSESAAIAAIDARTAELGERIDRLDAAILESPEKSLAVPLIRKDLENLDKNVSSVVRGMQGEIDRVYEFMKWFMGMGVTVTLAVIGLALGNLYYAKRDAL